MPDYRDSDYFPEDDCPPVVSRLVAASAMLAALYAIRSDEGATDAIRGRCDREIAQAEAAGITTGEDK